jgi:hypothetical protein
MNSQYTQLDEQRIRRMDRLSKSVLATIARTQAVLDETNEQIAEQRARDVEILARIARHSDRLHHIKSGDQDE